MKWADAVRRWGAYLSATGISPVTIRQYKRIVVNFMADTLLELNSVTEDDIVNYVASLPAKGGMRGNVLRALKSYYRWAENREEAFDPTKRLKIPKAKYGPAPMLEDEELTRLVIAAAWRNPRYAWMILLLYTTGGRATSLCHVKPEDVRGDRLVFRVVKGDAPYAVKLGPIAKEAVKELKKYGHPTLFGIGYGRLWEVVKQAGDAAGLHAWPHLFRHSYATVIARATDPRTWQELMGHQDLSQYRRYVATDDERMAKAVAKL